MTTTLNAIRKHSPCASGYAKLLKHLNKTKGDDEPLSLLTILESNGLDDAIWCLRTEPTLERTQRFALACARRVEHLNPSTKACNDVTERYLNGTVTKDELTNTACAASCAAYAAADAASCAAYAASCAASCAATTASNAANAAARAARAANAAANAAEREAQIQIFKEIFA